MQRCKPLRDAEGNAVYRTVQFDKPKVFSARVFNAEQIEGLPPLQHKIPDRDRHERAEAVLRASGVEIRHDQADRAFYRLVTDRIHPSARDGFKNADTYYAAVLHHLADTSGQPSRLDRDMTHPLGSVGCAEEAILGPMSPPSRSEPDSASATTPASTPPTRRCRTRTSKRTRKKSCGHRGKRIKFSAMFLPLSRSGCTEYHPASAGYPCLASTDIASSGDNGPSLSQPRALSRIEPTKPFPLAITLC